jgi:hypothetical protein
MSLYVDNFTISIIRNPFSDLLDLRRQMIYLTPNFKKCVCDVLLNFVFLAVVQLIGDKNGNPLPQKKIKVLLKNGPLLQVELGKLIYNLLWLIILFC